jgi:serine/threonine protein phosphatase PrpC
MIRQPIVSAHSHVGKVRKNNEDFFQYRNERGKLFLAAIADGVGGSPHGEMASLMSVSAALKTMSERIDNDMESITDAAFASAATKLASYNSGSIFMGMATTLVTLTISRRLDQAVVGYVGDSRAYWLHRGHIMQVTKDQSVNNVLWGVVSTHVSTKPGMTAIPLIPGDAILLCTDGVTNEISDPQLEKMLRRKSMTAEQIINAVLEETDAKDNASAILVQIP